MNAETLADLKVGLCQIEGLDLCSLNEGQIRNVLMFVDSMRSFLPLFIQEEPVVDIFRITVNRSVLGLQNNARLHRISQLKYPPAAKTNYGRANLPGTSVLYASFAHLTPRLEMKPAPGEIITLTQWTQVNPPDRIRMTAIFQDDEITKTMPVFGPYTGRFEQWLAERDVLTADLMRATSKFVARQFIKQVTTERKLEYAISAYIADLLLNHNDLEAIIYPSVPLSLMDVNIAMRPDVFDRCFRPVKASEQIVRSENYSSKTAEATVFDLATDTIVWDPEKSIPEEQLPTLHTMI